MQRTHARGTAGKTWAFADERRRVLEKLAVQLVHATRVAHATGVDLVDGHSRQAGCRRANFGHRAEVARVAHQPDARDMSEGMSHPLKAGLQRFATERRPQAFI